jgi:multiple sugar transport system substrate-binding protein
MIGKRFFHFLLFLSMAACSGTPDQNGTPPATLPHESGAVNNNQDVTALVEIDQVTIRFAVYDQEETGYIPLIQRFEEENPEIRIELVSINEIVGLTPAGGGWPEDGYARLAAAADVWNVSASREAVREGLVLDLTPLLENYNFDVDDFYPGVLEQAQWAGGTWFLRTELYHFVIFFNKQAFDRAGVDYPQPGWMWDDFLATAQALTMSDGDSVIQWGFIDPFPDGLAFVHAQAGPLFDGSRSPPTARFDSPEVVEAVRWFTDLFLVHQVAPGEILPGAPGGGQSNLPNPDGWQMIMAGQAGMWVDMTTAWSSWNRQMDVGIVPFPGSSQRRHTTHALGNGLSISAGANHPHESWRWLTFLSEQLPQQPAVLPARRSVSEAGGFWSSLDEEAAATLRYVVDHSYWWSTYILRLEGGSIYPLFTEAIVSILTGARSVNDALAEAQTKAQLVIEQTWSEQEHLAPSSPPAMTQPGDRLSGSEGAATIDFVVADSVENLPAYRELARQLESANPDVQVRIRQPDFSHGPVSMAGVAVNADCFQWGAAAWQDEKERAAVLNLDPFMDIDPAISREMFFPEILGRFTYEGELYALPVDVSIPLIAFNKALFEAANVPYPDPDWTTDDFLNIAIAHTSGEGENKRLGFVPEVDEFTDMLNMLQRRGARLLDETITPAAITFADSTVAEAMAWYVSLTADHEVMPASVANAEERRRLIENGRAAMWSSIDYSRVGEPDTSQLDVGLVPLPAEPDSNQRGGYQFVRGYFISAGTQARQACWHWITYLSQQPTVGSRLPARRDVAESPAFQQQVGSERAAAYLAAMERAGATPFLQYRTGETAWLAGSTRWLVAAYNEIVSGEAAPAAALARAQAAADEYRACVMANHGYADQAVQQACVEEASALSQ